MVTTMTHYNLRQSFKNSTLTIHTITVLKETKKSSTQLIEGKGFYIETLLGLRNQFCFYLMLYFVIA